MRLSYLYFGYFRSREVLFLDIISGEPIFRYGGHFDFYCFERYYGMLGGQINRCRYTRPLAHGEPLGYGLGWVYPGL